MVATGLGSIFWKQVPLPDQVRLFMIRADSSIAEIKPGMIDWEAVFDGAAWFHWTGITPAISEGAAEVCKEAIRCKGKRNNCFMRP